MATGAPPADVVDPSDTDDAPPPLPPDEPVDPMEKKRRKRLLVVQEILSTEKTYVDMLDAMEEVYYHSVKKFLDDKEHAIIFCNILTIRDLNKKFLDDVEKRLSSWNDTSCIGDLFLMFAPFFKMYTQYVNSHERAGELFTQMKKASRFEKFRHYEAQQRTLPRCKGTKLTTYLGTPVQRIPRYKLLLHRLLKYTDKSHPDHALVTKALAKVEEVADYINEAVRASENRNIILDIQNKFDGVVFVAPHRTFIVAGTLLKKVGKDVEKPYKFFLFNDVLVWAQHRKKEQKYKMANRVPIDEMFDVEKVPSKFHRNALKIIYDQQSFLVIANTKKDRESWYQALKKCIDERAKTIAGRNAKRKRASFVMAPVLQPKAAATKCHVCKKEFGLFRKKYSCKSCGEVVCADCSKARLLIAALDKKVRVCMYCVEKVSLELQSQADEEEDEEAPNAHTISLHLGTSNKTIQFSFNPNASRSTSSHTTSQSSTASSGNVDGQPLQHVTSSGQPVNLFAEEEAMQDPGLFHMESPSTTEHEHEHDVKVAPSTESSLHSDMEEPHHDWGRSDIPKSTSRSPSISYNSNEHPDLPNVFEQWELSGSDNDEESYENLHDDIKDLLESEPLTPQELEDITNSEHFNKMVASELNDMEETPLALTPEVPSSRPSSAQQAPAPPMYNFS